MTEWGVFGVITALIAFVVAVVKPIINLTQSITKLTVVVDKLSTDVDTQREQSIVSHEKLWAHNDEQDEKISDHERRIYALEMLDL